MEERGISAYIAELLGTFLLVFFIAMILSVQSGGVPGGILPYRDFAVVGLLHAFVLMMLIQSLGGVSGAHFNPAVTTALAAIRKISISDAVIYILLQLAGGVLGALACKLVVTDPGNAVAYGATKVSSALNGKAFTGMLVELIGTFVLMWAIMAVAVNRRGDSNWAGWVIGATLGFAVMTFGPLTGAGFNPARALGPSIVGGGESTGRFLLIYVLGPVIGALLAAFGYRALVLNPQEQAGARPIDKLD
jgi:MIP family channel proteins